MNRWFAAIVALPIWLSLAVAADPVVLRVNAFPNAKALPLHAGVANGIFAKHGLAIQLSFTENSTRQREGLAAGAFEIVLSAVDNAVALVDAAREDVIIVTGGEEDKANAAAILNLPFTIQAEQMGMKSLGSTVDMLGPYQANGAFVQRAWAKANAQVLERYIAAYVEALRWALQPANREASIGVLMEKLKISRDVAEHTQRMLADPARGFTADAKFDPEGFRNMLALRAEMEGGQVNAPQKYF